MHMSHLVKRPVCSLRRGMLYGQAAWISSHWSAGQPSGFFRVEDRPSYFVHDDGSGSVRFGCAFAGRIQAVAALVRKEKPVHFAVDLFLSEPHELVVEGIEVRRVLMGAPLPRGYGGQAVPLLTGHLAAATGGAARGVYEKCLWHMQSPCSRPAEGGNVPTHGR